MPGKCSHSCPRAAFLPALPLALFFMAASSSFPTRSSDRARIAATPISTILRTLPPRHHIAFALDGSDRADLAVAVFLLAQGQFAETGADLSAFLVPVPIAIFPTNVHLVNFNDSLKRLVHT